MKIVQDSNDIIEAGKLVTLDSGESFVTQDSVSNPLLRVNVDDRTVVADSKKFLGEQVVWNSSISSCKTEKFLTAGVPYYFVLPLLGETHLTSISIYVPTLDAGTITADLAICTYSKDGDITKKGNISKILNGTGFHKFSFDDYITFTDSDNRCFVSIVFDSGVNSVLVSDGTLLDIGIACKSVATGLTKVPSLMLSGDRVAIDFHAYLEARIGELDQVFSPDTPWTPLNDASLVEWWDPGDATTLTDVGGGEISDITSKSINASVASQVNDYARPHLATLDGITFLYYLGNDKLTGNMSLPVSGDCSFFMVAKIPAAGIGDSDESLFAFQGTHDFQFQSKNVSQFDGSVLSTVGSEVVMSGGPYSDNVVRIYSVVFNWTNGTIKAYINGSLVGSVSDYNVNKLSTSQQLRIMASTGEDTITEAYHADYIISESIDDATRQKIEGYLANKFDIKSSLPSGHPYKRVEPGV